MLHIVSKVLQIKLRNQYRLCYTSHDKSRSSMSKMSLSPAALLVRTSEMNRIPQALAKPQELQGSSPGPTPPFVLEFSLES